MTTTIVTAAGRRLTVTATPDEYGRVAYHVAKVGTFTIEPDPTGYPDRPNAVYVTYGRLEGPHRYHHGENLPDRPVVCRVELAGGAAFDYNRMAADRAWGWLSVRRISGGSAPAGTTARTADIVHALATDWRSRDDWQALRDRHDWHHAPARKAAHAREIARLNDAVADLKYRLAAEYHGYAEQAHILGEGQGLPPRQFPDPRTREGGAILNLRHELACLRAEQRYLPGAEVVQIVQEWLESMNLALPE